MHGARLSVYLLLLRNSVWGPNSYLRNGMNSHIGCRLHTKGSPASFKNALLYTPQLTSFLWHTEPETMPYNEIARLIQYKLIHFHELWDSCLVNPFAALLLFEKNGCISSKEYTHWLCYKARMWVYYYHSLQHILSELKLTLCELFILYSSALILFPTVWLWQPMWVSWKKNNCLPVTRYEEIRQMLSFPCYIQG